MLSFVIHVYMKELGNSVTLRGLRGESQSRKGDKEERGVISQRGGRGSRNRVSRYKEEFYQQKNKEKSIPG